MPVTRVLVTKDGRIVVEGVNYASDACLQDLQRLVEALRRYGIDVKVEQQQRKPEAQVSREVSTV